MAWVAKEAIKRQRKHPALAEFARSDERKCN